MSHGSKPVSVLKVGVLARCPRCGEGPLFRQLLNMRESCSSCGLSYRFVDTGDGPAVFAILILGVVVAGLAIYTEFTYEPPVWVHMIAWGLLTPLLAVGLLRFLKATLIALQYKNRAEEARLDKD